MLPGRSGELLPLMISGRFSSGAVDGERSEEV